MKVFLDVNVLMDAFTRREVEDASVSKFILESDPKIFFISSLTVHILMYILKLKPGSNDFQDLKSVIDGMNIISLDQSIINQAFAVDYKDFEDLIQYFSAIGNCDYLVTRDEKDFKKIFALHPSKIKIISKIPAITK